MNSFYSPPGFLAVAICLIITQSCSGSLENETTRADTTQVSHWPNGVTYEIFVQSFADSDGDGIGDFNGMISKLDYLEDLGVEAVWLMPIHPSVSYHKYDVMDYYTVHPDYGTMDDFKNFLDAAHERGIKVVIDLVVNHSGNDHPWFHQALEDEDSKYRDYYVWKSNEEIGQIGERAEISGDSDNRHQWHLVEGQDEGYFGFFWSGMPDLNFDNPEVREEIYDIGRFWLMDVGVDGFRLDAAKHIYPDERAEDNHAWWIAFRKEMEAAKEDVYLIGEVWDKAEVVAPYLAGLHAIFNFDMGFAITRAVQNENDTSLVKQNKKIRDFYQSITDDFIDATFTTNHDQNRIMSEVGNDHNKAKMAAALLFTLPGAPYIYYGEEIGMRGKKPDENIREPFMWTKAAQDSFRTSWMEPKYAEDVQPLSLQMKDPNSMYNTYKTLISLRNNSNILTYGNIDTTEITEPGIVSFFRTYNEDRLLVLHNLSNNSIAISFDPDNQYFTNKIFSSNENIKISRDSIRLPAYSTLIMEKE